MRVSICKPNGEVFAIHEISKEQCQRIMDALAMGFWLQQTTPIDDVVSDMETAIRNMANEEWDES